jgi:ribosomal protein S7
MVLNENKNIKISKNVKEKVQKHSPDLTKLTKKNVVDKVQKPNISKSKNFVIQLKKAYLFLSELSQSQLNDFRDTVLKKNYELKSQYKYLKATSQNIIVFSTKDIYNNHNFNKGFNSYYLYRDLTNKLFLKKLLNILMIHGKRSVATRILFKFFEILKLKFKISNPIRLLKYYIFKNLVPVIQTKVVGFKTQKVVGISLSIFKRIGISLKLFVKGAKMYNHPIVLGLLIEFLKFSKKKTFLQISNKKTLNDIKKNNLYKYLQLNPNSVLPEKKFLNSVLPKNLKKNLFTLSTLIKINWGNFNTIVYKLKLENSKKIQIRQFLILEQLKSYILKKHNLNLNDKNLFFSKFKDELLGRVSFSIKSSLVENDINNLFQDKNPNNLDLDLEFNNFKDINEILDIFKKFDIWKSQKILINDQLI